MTVDVDGLSTADRATLGEILNDARLSAQALARAAGKWVGMSEGARRKIVEGSSRSLRDFWGRLERVGAGRLHPQLVMIGGNAAVWLGKLPIEDQDRYLRDRIPVVVKKGRTWDTRLIDVAELNEEQRRQVFKENEETKAVVVRDEEMQKSYLAARAAALLVLEETRQGLKRVERVGWKVERGRVFVADVKVEEGLTRANLLQMLRDLTE